MPVLVVQKTLLWVESGHSNINARVQTRVSWIGSDKLGMAQNIFTKLNYIHAIVVGTGKDKTTTETI